MTVSRESSDPVGPDVLVAKDAVAVALADMTEHLGATLSLQQL